MSQGCYTIRPWWLRFLQVNSSYSNPLTLTVKQWVKITNTYIIKLSWEISQHICMQLKRFVLPLMSWYVNWVYRTKTNMDSLSNWTLVCTLKEKNRQIIIIKKLPYVFGFYLNFSCAKLSYNGGEKLKSKYGPIFSGKMRPSVEGLSPLKAILCFINCKNKASEE